MAEAKRTLAAIMAADVAGYSRLMGDDEQATMDMLNICRDVFRKRISEHEGRVVDTAGDNVLATFPSVVEAVVCAVDVQRVRHNIAMVIMIWHDSQYGLIKWHQDRRFGRSGDISFNNPDFVKCAESFGAKGYRVESTDELLPTLEKAFNDNTVVIVDVPVDYRENMKLTEKLGQLVCAD